ncbi:hypothetical protein Tcan_12215 [Toxocara canis]|uniref:Ashwin n=2 Tax=Toxocara canis TaxID=6265 RepID=A0A0B2W1A4_TOXCA|nr:hypothetical protein Tcan_12215 [Toxocara canis]VDM44074.1 unnamed protein product [Toxocara canis]
MFPELIRREELLSLLKAKFAKMGARMVKVDRCSDDELIDYARRFLIPKPQRPEMHENQHSSSFMRRCRGEVTDNCTLKRYQSEGNPVHAVPTTDEMAHHASKRFVEANGEATQPPKRRRKHSPIRFP